MTLASDMANYELDNFDIPVSGNMFFSSPNTFATSTRQQLQVSTQGNNCGLFALALGIKVALLNKAQLHKHARLPQFFNEIHQKSLQMITQETVSVGKKLRQELKSALLQNTTYKERRFSNFVSYCLDLLESRPLAPDMIGFKISNKETLLGLGESWMKLQAFLKNEINPDTEQCYRSLLHETISEIEIERLKEILSEQVLNLDIKQINELFVLNNFDPKNSLQNVIRLHQQFHTAWLRVISGSALQRNQLSEIINKLFIQKYLDIIKENDFTNNVQEASRCLVFCALSEKSSFGESGNLLKVSDRTELLSSATSFFVEHHVRNQWETVYQNYCDHLEKSQEFISADELGCLSSYWNIQLKIQFASGVPYTTYQQLNSNLLHVTLCNPSLMHWNVQCENQYLADVNSQIHESEKISLLMNKIKSTEWKKVILEAALHSESYIRRTEDCSYIIGVLSAIKDYPTELAKQGTPFEAVDLAVSEKLYSLLNSGGVVITAEEMMKLFSTKELLDCSATKADAMGQRKFF